MLRTDDFVAVDDHSPDLLLNTGILLRPVTPGPRRRRRRRPAAVLRRRRWPVLDVLPVAHGAPGLTAAGFPPLLLRVPDGERPPTPPELTIEEATTRGRARATTSGSSSTASRSNRSSRGARGVVFHPATLHVPGTRFFVGRVDGRPVSVAMSIAGCGVNHVEFVATLPDARGRGYGAAVTWEATLAEPELPAMLIATDMGRPVYERMGYVTLEPLDLPHGRALTGYAAWLRPTHLRGSRMIVVVRVSPRALGDDLGSLIEQPRADRDGHREQDPTTHRARDQFPHVSGSTRTTPT